MKVKVLVDCVGIGYNLKIGDTVELVNELANRLIKFNYVEEVKTRSRPKKVKG